MSAEYYDYYGNGGFRKYLEGIIPLLLLAIIGIVLLGKTTSIFCNVPVLNSVFCPVKITKIAVIGDFEAKNVENPTEVKAPEFKNWLDLEGPNWKVYYEVFPAEVFQYSKEALLKNYDIVVMVGERNFTRAVKDAIGWYVDNGGKLIIIGDAGIYDPGDVFVNGWGGELSRAAPVQLIDATGYQLKEPVLRIMDIEHPIYKETAYGIGGANFSKLKDKPSCYQELKIIRIIPNQGKTIAVLKGKDQQNKPKLEPAVIDSGALWGGRVIYFAYDPGCTPNALLNTIRYLSGKAR
ncbi:MAG: hypothetical protein QW735_02605 [archaeon]